jgi:hypothetical protein
MMALDINRTENFSTVLVIDLAADKPLGPAIRVGG